MSHKSEVGHIMLAFQAFPGTVVEKVLSSVGAPVRSQRVGHHKLLVQMTFGASEDSLLIQPGTSAIHKTPRCSGR